MEKPRGESGGDARPSTRWKYLVLLFGVVSMVTVVTLRSSVLGDGQQDNADIGAAEFGGGHVTGLEINHNVGGGVVDKDGNFPHGSTRLSRLRGGGGDGSEGGGGGGHGGRDESRGGRDGGNVVDGGEEEEGRSTLRQSGSAFLSNWLMVPSRHTDRYCDNILRLGKTYEEHAGVHYAKATERMDVSEDPWLELVSRSLSPRYYDKHCTVPGCPCAPQFVGIECNIMTPEDRTTTAPGLIEPAFAILGVQKGGTSSFIDSIRKHPHVRHADKSHFFSYVSFRGAFRPIIVDPLEKEEGPCLVIANYMQKIYQHTRTTPGNATSAHNLVFGGGDATLFFGGKVARRLRYFHPHIKMVVLFRNPITRAWSNFKMKMRDHKAGDFLAADAVKEAELQVSVLTRYLALCDYHNDIESCLASQVTRKMHQGDSVTKGLYKLELANWLRYFPNTGDNYLFLQSENFAAREQECMDIISDFIGIPRYQFPAKALVEHNTGGTAVMPIEMEELLTRFYKPYTQSFFTYLKERKSEFTHMSMDESVWDVA
eukprot:TRINITY_DN1391_c1_g1_i1.p1 TRINITY_DN1391_c1_g1~~TRINITY_DN1391_c1_g1_i1.p1  ORF type:complete len:541 (+),score=106.93 TRINITY_DN1391_c1_g1_i1:382-2004(+)